jgi:hypothetical protein
LKSSACWITRACRNNLRDACCLAEALPARAYVFGTQCLRVPQATNAFCVIAISRRTDA